MGQERTGTGTQVRRKVNSGHARLRKRAAPHDAERGGKSGDEGGGRQCERAVRTAEQDPK